MIAATRFNGQAELVTVPEAQVLPLAEEALVRAGGGVPRQLRHRLRGADDRWAGCREGDRVLIHAAAGGVGISATQIAKGVGAEIFGTASASKHDAIREQGVDHAIDYRNAGLRAGGAADHRTARAST